MPIEIIEQLTESSYKEFDFKAAIYFFAIVIEAIGIFYMLKRAICLFLPPLTLSLQFLAASGAELSLASNKTDSTILLSEDISHVSPETEAAATASNIHNINKDKVRLKGSVVETGKVSPLLYGTIESIPKGTKLNLSVMGNLNSQINKLGDDILARISLDVNNGDKVLLPGGWFLHGTVTELASQKRLGRDGYVTVEFDKLLSPDGEIDLPFKSTFSTKDNQLKAITKTVFIDSGYVSLGALGGSIVSAQITGIPLAISTHGISVGAGAAVGAGLGLIGALKRKGKIASFFPGDEMTITTAEPIIVPGFDARFIPSTQENHASTNFKIHINHYTFSKDPFGDKRSKQLLLSITIENGSKKEVSFFDLVILSDYGERYYPSLTPGGLLSLKTKIKPGSKATADIAFNVSHSKHKYSLILIDKASREEITRCQIN